MSSTRRWWSTPRITARSSGSTGVWGTASRFEIRDLFTGEASGEQTAWQRRGCTGLRSSANLVTTRFRANVACIDLASRDITSMWNVRPGCYNNLFPANGVLNAPSLT